MKRSAVGERLWRDMRVTVCLPGQKDIVWRNHAKPRQGWTVEALDNMLGQVANYVEKQYPSIEFRLVELAPNDFKFIYHGKKGTMITREFGENLNACPELARAPKIAEEVCAKLGHKLSTYQNGSRMTPNGPEMSVINFCSACGLSLAEVRGEIDKRINEAVDLGVKQHVAQAVAAMNAAKIPQPPNPNLGAGPFPLPTMVRTINTEDITNVGPSVVDSSAT